MNRKITKESLKSICETFNDLSYGTTGIRASCICHCYNGDHSERNYANDRTYDNDTVEYFIKTCKNISELIVEDSDKHVKLEEQVKALQEAYKSIVTRLDLIKGILHLDPHPSEETKAALLLADSNLEYFGTDPSVKDLPHFVFVKYYDNGEITDIKWIRYASGAGISIKKDD